MVCNCPPDLEIECIDEGGWWYAATLDRNGYCEWPSHAEHNCKEEFGYWETVYYDVNGMIS